MKNNRVGILTFHRADNLGAVLQAYALQTVLTEKYTMDAHIVDYRCEAVDKATRSANGLKGLLLRGYYFWKHIGFECFRKKYLKQSRPCSAETICDIAEDYDAFIVGSDQVWNYECSGWDNTYFLDFASSIPKFAYAASIGNYQYKAYEQDKIKLLLDDFTKISVREESGKKELESFYSNHIPVCPDPVLLLSQAEWKNIMPRRLYSKPYVFVYLIQQDVNTMAMAEEYARKHKCKIICNKTSLEFILHGAPCDFLAWVYYAERVFTNSFHGTAFSLLFQKQFFADIELVDGGINHRVWDLLKASGTSECAEKTNIDPVEPNYSENMLADMREMAYTFLDFICEDR